MTDRQDPHPDPVAKRESGRQAAIRMTGYARTMRHAPTTPELRLWMALRNRQLAGMKFRRQTPLGRYIVDFYCIEAKLVVEVDGESHARPGADTERDAWLASQGLRVLRIWNNQIMQNLHGVLQHIAAIATAPSPASGEGRGEG